MSTEVTLEVDTASSGMRIDAYLAAQGAPFQSRSFVKRLIEESRVWVNRTLCTKPSYRVEEGECITVEVPIESDEVVQPQSIPLDIVYEDESLLVVNKERGMVVHPAPGNPDGTLVNALLAHCGPLPTLGGDDRPGIVHRIDKETSGLMVVAKTEQAFRHLAQQLRERSVRREYIAYVHGTPQVDRGTIDAPIARHPKHRQKMAVVEQGGRVAVTHFRVLERFEGFAKIEARLETGRTHQIRVHMAHIGHPLVGDLRYGAGRKTPFNEGQALHAWRLIFMHPETHQYLEFTAPLPAELLALEARLRSLTPRR